jgi:hypothetical protein
MLNSMLANFYEMDLRKLIEEINLFKKNYHLGQVNYLRRALE